MPISKPITAPNGAAVTFHKAMQATLDVDTGTVNLNVASWASDADYLAGAGLTWMWPLELAASAIANLDAALEQAPPFDGGTIVPDPAVTLEGLRGRAWLKIHDARNAAIYAGLLIRVPSASWDAVDGGTAALSEGDIAAMSAALGAWVQANLVAAAGLRSTLDAASTPQAIAAVQWIPVMA